MGVRREIGSEKGNWERGGKVRVRRVLQLIQVLTPRPLPCWCPSRQKGFYSQTTSSGLKILSQTWVPDTYVHSSTTERQDKINHHTCRLHGLDAIITHRVRP